MLSVLLIALLSFEVASPSFGLKQVEVLTNCSAGANPCGPVCCGSGFDCNFRRGIPVCFPPDSTGILGFNDQPCSDPYLRSCDVIGITGFCCPIGTLCFNGGDDKTISCVDADGTTASSFPSATIGLVPSATPVLATDASIIYAPIAAWNISNDASCTTNNRFYTTNTLNATISFNYSGPSIEVNVINAPNGGVFSVVVDGFNTSSTIDTFIGTADDKMPSCFPYQFPPFAITPPEFSSKQNHTITLVFIGLSEDVPVNISTIIGQFNSFAIPDIVATTPLSNHAITLRRMGIYGILVFIILALNFSM